MSITAKELAAKLNLSEAAISIVLNNKPGVSTTTRKRVLEAAHKYGYDFQKKAVSSTVPQGTICFVIYHKSGTVIRNDTAFFSALSNGVSIGCKREHYDLVIRYVYEDEDLEEQLYNIKTSQFSGIILLATEMDDTSISYFSDFELPIVILDSYFEMLDYDCVKINNAQGAFLATSHLISKRKTQPGYLCSSYPTHNFQERSEGFYKAIRTNGMSRARCVVHALSPSQEGAYADMKEILESGEEPAPCYFADNDLIAIGAITALKECGYRIPEDIAVIGFGDLPLCEFVTPTLTTINAPTHFMGKTAVGRLVQLITERDTLTYNIEIRTTLLKRNSV